MSKAISYKISPVNYQEKENPMQTEGFAFLEFTAPAKDATTLHNHMKNLGCGATAKHKAKDITLYQQSQINFFVNVEPNTHAAEFAKIHGPSVSAMGFKVKDANFAYERAISLGAKAYTPGKQTAGIPLPAIYGIGNSLIYFVDDNNKKIVHEQELESLNAGNTKGAGLQLIDHVTHNVYQGNMDPWAQFYERLFNFREIRYFDISGKATGLTSRAMSSPCGNIKIPLNESKDSKSQIEEFLKLYNGEGIQHIALVAEDIYNNVKDLKSHSIKFLDTPDVYYNHVNKRIPNHNENLDLMRQLKILIDGDIEKGHGLLLQIFTENMLGPVFFEIIQRKGNEGFGEGNFQALFEAMEEDQVRRGTLEID